MVQKVYDELAYGMEKVLADESYQQIFAKPKIKTASSKASPVVQVKLSADGITDTFKTLVALSSILDDMGFSKSSERLLKAAQEIRDEVQIDELDPDGPEAKAYLGGLGGSEDSDGELDALMRELGQGGEAWDLSQDLPKDLPDLGDANDAMDKPAEEDKEEGNPEC